MRQTNVWMDWFKLCVEYVMRGWEIHHKHSKTKLSRLIELQPGEYLFQFLVESSFLLHMPSMQEPSVVFETVLLLCHYSRSSISSSQILGSNFFLKKTIQVSLYLICVINRLHDANELLMKDRCIKAVSRSPHPTKAWLP